MFQEKLGQYIIGKKRLLSASIKELVCILTLIGKEHPQISIGLVKFIRSSLRFCKPKICNFTVVFQSACRLGELCINSKLTQMEKVYFDIVYRFNFSNFMQEASKHSLLAIRLSNWFWSFWYLSPWKQSIDSSPKRGCLLSVTNQFWIVGSNCSLEILCVITVIIDPFCLCYQDGTHLRETRSELKPVRNFKLLWKFVLFAWTFS